MICVNTFLFVQIKAKNRILGQENDIFINEKLKIFLVIMLFATSYFIRSLWDLVLFKNKDFNFG